MRGVYNIEFEQKITISRHNRCWRYLKIRYANKTSV